MFLFFTIQNQCGILQLLDVDFTLACTLGQGMFLDAALENLLVECAVDNSQDFACTNACSSALNNTLGMVLDAGFYKSLQQSKDQLPSASQNRERLQDWRQKNYSAWMKQLRGEIAHYRNIHQSWQFSLEQQQMLQRYYDTNQLLIDCLNSNCKVTAALRQDIEATSLLSQRELEDREWQGD